MNATTSRVPLSVSAVPLAGWVLSLLIPIGVYIGLKFSIPYLPSDVVLTENSIRFIAIIAMAVNMWIFNLAAPFVPALLILLLTIMLEAAPRDVVMSGFTSEAFFLILGIFIMAAQIFSSGLVYRLALTVLQFMPPVRFSQNLIVFLSGSALTTVLPSPIGRSALITPLMIDLVEDIPDLKKNKIDITPLVISALHGTTLLSTIFLTGNPLNLVLLDLAGSKTKFLYGQWGQWLTPTIVAGVMLVAGWLLVMAWQSKKSNLPVATKEKIKKHLEDLGPMDAKEWGSLIALGVFIFGAFTVKYHHIPLAWLAFGISMALFLYGMASAQDLKSMVDWPTLLFIAALTSWQPIMNYLQIDQLLIKLLNKSIQSLNLTSYVGENFSLLWILIVGLSIGIMLIRFPVPGGPAFIILMTAFTPLAASAGFSPWVLGFILLTISEGFFLPHQHGVYTLMVAELEQRGFSEAYSKKDLLIANAFLMAVRVAAVCISLYYWRLIAII